MSISVCAYGCTGAAAKTAAASCCVEKIDTGVGEASHSKVTQELLAAAAPTRAPSPSKSAIATFPAFRSASNRNAAASSPGSLIAAIADAVRAGYNIGETKAVVGPSNRTAAITTTVAKVLMRAMRTSARPRQVAAMRTTGRPGPGRTTST